MRLTRRGLFGLGLGGALAALVGRGRVPAWGAIESSPPVSPITYLPPIVVGTTTFTNTTYSWGSIIWYEIPNDG